MYTLKAQHLIKRFREKGGRITAVDDVSFNIKRGEIFGLLGVNGAGKSTTINILSGLTLPDSGKLEILGKDFFKNQEELKGRFNIATAYYSMSHQLSVIQNLRVFARLYNIPKPEDKIKELSERFMINHHYHTKVRSLSSGERTRTILVKALLNDPELLFLDECTVGLDPDMAELTRDYLLDYNQETDCSILFTSHYMQEVERLCNRIAFMDQGKIVKIGKAQQLLKELQWQKVHLSFSKNINQAKNILQKSKIPFELTNDHGISFRIQNKQKVLYPLFEKFIHAKVFFDDVHLEKPTLEEYFIKHSRK